MSDNIATSTSALQQAFAFKDNLRSMFVRRASNYASIDGIRAVSILLVMVYHIFLVYEKSNPNESIESMLNQLGMGWSWVVNGDKGVDVFFVMSGFLITGILLRTYAKLGHLNLKNFYIRRYLRLTPVYYFMLVVYFLLSAPNSENIWANFLYVSNFIDYKDQAAGWTWSLAVEEQFYFIYPLILIAILKLGRHPGYWLVGLLVLSLLVNTWIVVTDSQLSTTPFSQVYTNDHYYNHYFTVIYDNLYTRFGGLVVGCIAGYAMHFYPARVKALMNSSAGLLLTLLALIIIVLFMSLPLYLPKYDAYGWLHILYDISNHTLFAIGLGLLILALILQEHRLAKSLNWLFSLRFWYPIATLSYSLYLIHLVVMIAVIPPLMQSANYTMGEVLLYGGFLSSVISFIIAALMYLFIEKPVMNLRK